MRSVSDIKIYKPALVWLGISGFFALFAAIYEHFSFGVYSVPMICAFLYPLLLGFLPCLVLGRNIGRLWNDGVLLLLFGSVLTGVLEIYGTTSNITPWFRIAGILCLGISAAFQLALYASIKKRKRSRLKSRRKMQLMSLKDE